MQVYEGTSQDGPQLLEICSSKHPPTVISSGNALTIALANVTEYDYAFAFEFKAYYSVIENGKRKIHHKIEAVHDVPDSYFLHITIPECGGSFSSLSGQLASPGFPRRYDSALNFFNSTT